MDNFCHSPLFVLSASTSEVLFKFERKIYFDYFLQPESSEE